MSIKLLKIEKCPCKQPPPCDKWLFTEALDGRWQKERIEYIQRAVNSHEILLNALKLAKAHLEWTGYGDKYEHECAIDDKLPEVIENAIANAEGGKVS